MTQDHDRNDDLAPAHSQEHLRQQEEVRTDDLATAESTDAIANPTARGAADYRGRGAASLLPADEESAFQRRWETIQASFVDEPRKAVEEADQLVAGLMRRLAETFADTRGELEGQWGRGDQVSTEELRVSLQRYRSFFGRLLRV